MVKPCMHLLIQHISQSDASMRVDDNHACDGYIHRIIQHISQSDASMRVDDNRVCDGYIHRIIQHISQSDASMRVLCSDLAVLGTVEVQHYNYSAFVLLK